jgi:hypothetical protein
MISSALLRSCVVVSLLFIVTFPKIVLPKVKKNLRRSDYEFTVFYPFKRDKFIRERLKVAGFSFKSDYFKAIMMVKMNVLAGQDYAGELMLDIQRFVDEFSFVVVIDHHYRPGDFFIFFVCLLGHVLAYKEADGLASVGKLMLPYDRVQLVKQVFFQGHAESFYFFHSNTFFEKITLEMPPVKRFF